tara:strand:+ start:326 stop:457 length:132 start_codon:yes stop_codon:yes gene_type:complete
LVVLVDVHGIEILVVAISIHATKKTVSPVLGSIGDDRTSGLIV